MKQHAALDKEAAIDVRRSKTTTQDDIREDSRQSDVSAMTEDYTECSSSYGLQEGQIAEISQCLKVTLSTQAYFLVLMIIISNRLKKGGKMILRNGNRNNL